MLNYTLMLARCTLKALVRRDNISLARFFMPLILCLPLLLFSLESGAQTSAELKQVDASLKQSKSVLKQDKRKRQQVAADIQRLERNIAERSLRYEQTRSKVKTLDRQTEQLESERDALLLKFSEGQQQLVKLLQSAYLMGRQSGLKIALSQQGVQQMSRLNRYARDIAAARQQQLDQLRSLQEQVVQKNNSITAQRNNTNKLSIALAEDQRKLKQLKRNRIAMINKLDKSIINNEVVIDQLQLRKIRLEKLLSKLAAQQRARAERKHAQQQRQRAQQNSRGARKVAAPTRPSTPIRPISRSGSLPMPANAKIVARFGDRRAKSDLPWTGILMEGRDGSRVSAVSDGEIVYAGWLQGYGQMVIVDHGDGVMSLYGHNKRILKAVGDQVRQSDTIATMGNTAGLKRAALYFEIRKNGIAQDPLKWVGG